VLAPRAALAALLDKRRTDAYAEAVRRHVALLAPHGKPGVVLHLGSAMGLLPLLSAEAKQHVRTAARLGSGRARLLRPLWQELAAWAAWHSQEGRGAGPLGAQPLPRVLLERAAFKAADPIAFGHSGGSQPSLRVRAARLPGPARAGAAAAARAAVLRARQLEPHAHVTRAGGALPAGGRRCLQVKKNKAPTQDYTHHICIHITSTYICIYIHICIHICI
jgi:hypothetical protein